MPDHNRKPNFLVVGAAKSGTTSLYEYFKAHPQIYVPPRVKETNFFVHPKSVLGAGPRYYPTADYGKYWDKYLALFAEATADHLAVGEVCPTYLPFHRQAIPRIKKHLDDEVKIIIILRDPVERAFSHYMYNVRETDETESFQRALELEERRIQDGWWSGFYLVSQGMYHEQVKAYLDHFSHVRVHLFEDLRQPDFYRNVFDFLGVRADVPLDTTAKHNISGRPKNMILQKLIMNQNPLKSLVKTALAPLGLERMKKLKSALLQRNISRQKLDPAMRVQLSDVFRDDVLALSQLIKRDLSHWLTPAIEKDRADV